MSRPPYMLGTSLGAVSHPGERPRSAEDLNDIESPHARARGLSAHPRTGRLTPVTDDTCWSPPITDVTLPDHLPGLRCMVTAVTATAGPWTVWMADDDDLDLIGGAGVFAAEGTEPGDPAYWVWPSHGKAGARDHGSSCNDPWYGGCDCGAETALTAELRHLLPAACRRLVREHYRRKDERAMARRGPQEQGTRLRAADQASRILVGGSDAGWRLWQDSPPRNTGIVILPPGPIPRDLGPQPHGLAGDAVCLYAIRDPRTARRPQTGAG